MSGLQVTIAKSLSVAVVASGVLAAPAAVSAADYSGKQVTIIVPFDEGSSANRVARLFSPFFTKYLPGKPVILVRNMPGGGSVRGSNYFQKTAKPDGLTSIVVSTSTQTSYLLGGKKIQYDLLAWEYVLTMPLGSVFYVNPKTGVKGKNVADDIKTLRNLPAFTLGAKSPASSDLRAFLAYELLGVKNIKAVFGLSAGKRRKALLRGELDGNLDSGGAYIKGVVKYVKTGKVVPLMTLGYTQKGKIVRDPAFPKMPTIIDVYKAMHGGKEPSGLLFEVYKSFYGMSVMTNKSFALPAKTPKDVLDSYIEAAKKTLKD
ncbi:MAG: hypothetical protein RIB59_17275, partial [Rhodospirillales bacterium]